MSKRHLAIGAGLVGALSLFALSAVTDTVSARGWKGGEHHGGYGRHHGGGRKSFRKLRGMDADGNGEVTKAEFLAPKEKRFGELDGDADGKLTETELFKEMDETADYYARRAIKDFDANSDAKISKDEYEADARKRFGMRDRDGDGRIEGDEMRPRWKHRRMHRGDRTENEGRGDGVADGDTPAEAAAATEPSEKSAETGNAEERGDGDSRGWRGRDRKDGKRHGWHHRGGKRGGGARTIEDTLERSRERFASRDSNSDGFIDADEIRARGAERMASMKKQRIGRLDTDNNGSVSKEEYLAKSQVKFSKLDLDSDGVITVKDLPPRAARRWTEKSGKRD
ncbi:MAG: hypothetical protein KJ587_18930 [Alphaproteobacteria bacterium]|nr:hypothetical protein [Alphaproteobacteria bacterium]